MTSLRDIGYDLPSAVADLVDNSIDAHATTVAIEVCRKGECSFIRIADNGHGMTERVLDEAMRYGTRRSYGDHDLGKFGLGLKTASLSQCRRLTVATKTTPAGRIRIRRWDLDEVRARDAWELERLVSSECPSYLVDPIRGEPGTVVLWEKLDRILAYARPDGEHAIRALEAMSESIAEHLSMVFHRFLSGDTSDARTLEIVFNGESLEPWDPFARRERGTRKLAEQRLLVEHRESAHVVRIRPYVLPGQVQFSSIDAHAAAAGPKKWNRQQGFYIYRGDRMIQSGGWNRLRTMDEHSKLARIALDVPAELEHLFQINVAKMRVIVPDEMRPQLRALAAGVVNMAQEAYRRRLRLISSDSDPLERHEEADFEPVAWTMGDLWSVIADVVARELRDHPELVERVLVALANARPGDSRSNAAGSA
jgi:Histidine kinase-, DNA gyrase B-, and HSP90-like ATPase